MAEDHEEWGAGRAKAEAIERELVRWRNQVTMTGSPLPQVAEPGEQLTASTARRALTYVRSTDNATYEIAEMFADAGQLELTILRLDAGGLMEARSEAEQELVRVRAEIQRANGLLSEPDRGGDDARRKIAEIASLLREAAANEPRATSDRDHLEAVGR